MNRRHTKLYLMITILALAFVAPFLLFKSMIEVTAGTGADPVSGLYMKVKDTNPIEVGDKVLFASTSRVVMTGAGGNPGYIFGDTNGFYMSDNDHEGHSEDSDDRIYANNSNILEFEVCQGSKEGTFAFKTKFAMLGESEKNVTAYLAYTPDESFVHHYYGIAYWQCGTGFDDGGNKDSEAWEVSYNKEEGISRITNYVTKTELKYRSGGSTARIWFGLNGEGAYNWNNTIGVNIYKKVEATAINNISAPTKTTYKPNEEIDLSGLHFDFTYSDAKTSRTETIYYDDEAKDLFIFPSRVYNSGTQDYQVEYLGVKFNVNLAVNDLAYKKIDTTLDDYSGIVVLIWHQNTDYLTPSGTDLGSINNILDNVRENGDYFSTFYGKAGDITWNEAASFIVCFDGYNYYIKNYNGQYLRKNTDGTVYLSSEKGDPIYFSISDGTTHIRLVNTYETLCLHGGNTLKYKSDASGDGLMVYSASLKSDVIDSVNSYANKIHDTIKTGDKGRYFNETSWGYIKEEFNSLSPLAQAYIKNIYYNHNSEIKDSIEDMIDVYDNTVTRYSDDYDDFMERKVSYAYVNYVVGLINDIGIVTLDKEDLINDASDAYYGLSYNQRASVSSDLVDKLEEAKERLKVLKVTIKPLQQEAIVGESTFVRFVFILNGYNELSSSDFENKLTIILDDGKANEKTIVRTPNAYNRITLNGETYTANIDDSEYEFDNAVNNDDIYIVYVIEFTTSKYQGHNVKAKLVYNEIEYKTSGYDFI